MGREIRRVPADWEHPRHTEDTARYRKWVGEYMSLYDEDYKTAAQEWSDNFHLWLCGKHPDPGGIGSDCEYFWEWDSPPDRTNYRSRRWTEDEATHFQVYETVSEGSPVSPVLPTKEAVIEYLTTKGDFWDQSSHDGPWSKEGAEQLFEWGSMPSMMVVQSSDGADLRQPKDGM